jgi:hypothetical protein
MHQFASIRTSFRARATIVAAPRDATQAPEELAREHLIERHPRLPM